jgi:hypothetical protein
LPAQVTGRVEQAWGAAGVQQQVHGICVRCGQSLLPVHGYSLLGSSLPNNRIAA